jgi:hypothetical protein
MNKWFQTHDRLKFETLYSELKLDLKDKDICFFEKLYQTKNDWARAYNPTCFNANTFTTTRNESWHSKIKRSLSSYTELSDLVITLLELDSNSV